MVIPVLSDIVADMVTAPTTILVGMTKKSLQGLGLNDYSKAFKTWVHLDEPEVLIELDESDNDLQKDSRKTIYDWVDKKNFSEIE